MRMSSILRLFLLILLLATLTVPALAAPCVQCGRETGDDDYLCNLCFVDLLDTSDEPAPLAFKRICRDYWGNVRVQWTDAEGGAPYRVMYAPLEEAPTAFGWTDAEGVTATHHTLGRLVPGVSYVITVADSKGHFIEQVYEAETADVSNRIGAAFTLATQRCTSDGVPERADFSLAELASGNAHSLNVQPTYGRLAYGYLYGFHLAVEAPNGFRDVVYSGMLDLSHGDTYLDAWREIPMDGYFDCLERYYGGVPAGEYQVVLYFNGTEIVREPFTVAE